MAEPRNPPAQITRAQAMASVPHRTPGVEIAPSPGGGARVTSQQPTARFARAILRMPAVVPRRFDIDSFGLAVLNRCDGKQTVRQIIDAFAAEQKLDPAEAERAVTLFLQTLLRKGIVTMAVPR